MTLRPEEHARGVCRTEFAIVVNLALHEAGNFAIIGHWRRAATENRIATGSKELDDFRLGVRTSLDLGAFN